MLIPGINIFEEVFLVSKRLLKLCIIDSSAKLNSSAIKMNPFLIALYRGPSTIFVFPPSNANVPYKFSIVISLLNEKTTSNIVKSSFLRKISENALAKLVLPIPVFPTKHTSILEIIQVYKFAIKFLILEDPK